MTAYAALMAALTAVGAFIAIPVGPVPIVLQNLFVYLEKAVADVAAMICGTAVIYFFGVGWLKILTGMSLVKTLAVGMIPFLIGDALKIAAAAALAKALRPMLKIGRF
ncbi:MAG: biotin transporter BioY [Deltaproteobacteria bacterium]